MASTIGKLVFGGGAIFMGYKFGNSTIDSFTQNSKYTDKKINERMRLKPGGRVENRSKIIEGLKSEVLDVLVVGGNLKASRAALDSASRGLKTGLVDSEDFNSTIDYNYRSPEKIGSFSKVIERFKNENLEVMEKIFNMDHAEEYLQYLKSAPHLASVLKILILIPNWGDFPLQYIGNKLSDVLVNKPPKYSTKLVCNSTVLNKVPWCAPEGLVGGVEVTEVLFDANRLNLATVISAAQWGSLTLNHCKVVNVEKKDEFLLVGLEDKIANVCYEVKTKVLLKIGEEERHIVPKLCFEVPNILVENNHGVCLPDKDIVILSTPNETTACLKGDLEPREAFDKLKKIVRKQYILRKGDLVTKPVDTSPKPIIWEISSLNNMMNVDIDKNPVDEICNGLNLKPLRASQMSDMTLEGGHGWFPSLGLSLCSRYGLSNVEAQHLIGKYGDQAPSLARLLQEKKREETEYPLLEVEVLQACKEMAQTVTQVMKRMNIQNENQVFVVADVMGKQLGWSEKFKENQIGAAQEYFASFCEIEKWKELSKNITDTEEIDEKFINLQRQQFIMKSCKSKLMHHGQVEDILSNHEPFISEDTLDTILRGIDIGRNGEYTENEFIEIMKSIHVKTPEEVIENHVQNIIDSKI